MDEGDFLFRYSALDQLCFYILVYMEAFSLWGRQVAEQELGQFFRRRIPPDPQHTVYAGVGLAHGVIRQKAVEHPLVQGQLAPVAGDAQHIILGGLDAARPHRLRPIRQG